MTLFGLLFGFTLGLVSPQTADIVFAGDAMQHEKQLNAAKRTGNVYDFSDYYKGIEPYIKSADLAVVNLETPIAGAPYSGYPCFNAPDSYLAQLKTSGFDFILAANNHTLDRRDRGLRGTIDRLNAEGLPYVGIYRNRAERDSVCPVVCDVNGFKIAFLNYTYGTNGIPVQGDVVVDYIDRKQIAEDVRKAKDSGAEIIAACMHWGIEYVLLPNQEQKQLADFLEDQGVDLIIGGHPHVIQPMEMRYNRKYDKKVFVVYSLGNFVSAMKKDDTQGGAMVRVRLRRDDSGRAVVDTATYRLVFVTHPSASDKSYRVLPAEGPMPVQWMGARERFVSRARNIFEKYNKNVPADTAAIDSYME
ncbi:MAG: CapA family protein [Paramuribaculum sp.]|nr:CapA family protein [Paramuribaculum sp.]